MAPMISTQIEIAASPAIVRQKFLNFPTIPTYHPHGFIRSLSPLDPKSPTLTPGSKMNNRIGNMVFTPTILVNNASEFRWRGTWHEVFTGEHIFRFEEIESEGNGGEGGDGKGKGRTMFVQEEKFSGLLAFLMGEGWVARLVGVREETRRGFVGFNGDFKGWCEGVGK